MSTVDFQPGAGPRFEAAGGRIVPHGQARRVFRIGTAGKCMVARPVGQLVFGPLGIGEVAIEMPGLRSQRLKVIALLVTALALVGVGDDVVVGPLGSLFVDPADVDQVAGDVEPGLGLLGIPDIRQSDPAIGLPLENARFEQPPSKRRVARVDGIGEGLGDHGADGKLERLVLTILGDGALGQPDEAILIGVIREQGRIQIVGNHASERTLRAAVALEQAIFGKLLGRLVARHGRSRTAPGDRQGQQQRRQGNRWMKVRTESKGAPVPPPRHHLTMASQSHGHSAIT